MQLLVYLSLIFLPGIEGSTGSAWDTSESRSGPQLVPVATFQDEKKLELENKDLKKKLADLEKDLKEAKKAFDAFKKEQKSALEAIQQQLADSDNAKKTLDANLKIAVNKLTTEQAASDKLREDVRGLKKDKQALIEKNQGLATDKKELVAQREADLAEFKALMNKFGPDLSITPDAKLFKAEKGLLAVGFHEGKRDEAQKLCEALNFKFIGVFGPKNDILQYKWTMPVTQETLNILGTARSIIRSVQPKTPIKSQGTRQHSPGLRHRWPHGRRFRSRRNDRRRTRRGKMGILASAGR